VSSDVSSDTESDKNDECEDLEAFSSSSSSIGCVDWDEGVVLGPKETKGDTYHKDGLEGVGEVSAVGNYSSCNWLGSDDWGRSDSRGVHNW
jgi:hypothetical protein